MMIKPGLVDPYSHGYRDPTFKRCSRMWFMFLILLVFYPGLVPGQTAGPSGTLARSTDPLKVWEDSLSVLADTMQNSDTRESRRAAAFGMEEIFSHVLTLPGSWDYPFDSIQQVSFLRAPGEEFRLITWQVFLDPDHYQQFGFLQTRQDPGHPLELRDRSEGYVRPQTRPGSPEDWYGAVYYSIRECRKDKQPYWLLFGFDSHRATSRVKLIEVLTFGNNGQPVFGAPVFEFPEQAGHMDDPVLRIVLDYALGSQVRLNYDESRDMILFDHVVPFADDRSGLGMVQIPDGTYEGFTYRKGVWSHVEKVFHEVMDAPPVEKPVLDSRKGKNIFGR